jgi:hypothetical protein
LIENNGDKSKANILYIIFRSREQDMENEMWEEVMSDDGVFVADC